MQIFYTPDITNNPVLPQEESAHAIRVLRLTEGTEVMLTDGKGSFYKAVINCAHAKRCGVTLLETIPQPCRWPFRLHIAVAPTKNMDRMEWLVEKTTEIGVDEISFLRCRFSERKEIKINRVEKVAVSAMKQSQKATLPLLNEITDFKKFITQPFSGQKFIAHCEDETDKKLIRHLYKQGEDAVILIGPEGDFSPEEIALAKENGFLPISLGESRLRTETAALAACHTLHVLNQQ